MNARTQQLMVVGGVVGAGLLVWMLIKSRTASASGIATSGPGGYQNRLSPASSAFSSPVLQTLPSGIYSGAGGALFQSALPAITVAQASSQATTWAGLTPTSAPAQSGYVNFPSGSQAAVALLPWRTDGTNFFTNWAGVVYRVPLSADQYGNLTAIPA